MIRLGEAKRDRTRRKQGGKGNLPIVKTSLYITTGFRKRKKTKRGGRRG